MKTGDVITHRSSTGRCYKVIRVNGDGQLLVRRLGVRPWRQRLLTRPENYREVGEVAAIGGKRGRDSRGV